MEIKDLEINKALPVVSLSDNEMSTVIAGQAMPSPVSTAAAAPPAAPAPPAPPAPPVKRMVAGRWVPV